MKRVKRFLAFVFDFLKVFCGFFALFSFVFSVALGLSYFFLDCVLIPLSVSCFGDGDGVPFFLQSVFLCDHSFRFLFCFAVSFFTIFDWIASR